MDEGTYLSTFLFRKKKPYVGHHGTMYANAATFPGHVYIT